MGIFEEGILVRILDKATSKTFFYEGNYNWYEGQFEFVLEEDETN